MVSPLLLILAGACRAAPPPAAPGATVTDHTLHAMMSQLADEHPEGFGRAINWLVAHPDLASPALRAAIVAEPDSIATMRGLVAIARIGAAEDVPAIETVLLTAKTESATWDAANALGAHPHGSGPLLAAAKNPSDTIAGAAASAIGTYKIEAGRAAVEALLLRADPGVRYRSVRALAELGVEPSRAALTALARTEKDPDVREALAALKLR